MFSLRLHISAVARLDLQTLREELQLLQLSRPGCLAGLAVQSVTWRSWSLLIQVTISSPWPNAPGPVKLRTSSCMMSCSKQGGRTQQTFSQHHSCATNLHEFLPRSANFCSGPIASASSKRVVSPEAQRPSRVLKVTPGGRPPVASVDDSHWFAVAVQVAPRTETNRGNRSDAANWRANLLMWGVLWIIVNRYETVGGAPNEISASFASARSPLLGLHQTRVLWTSLDVQAASVYCKGWSPGGSGKRWFPSGPPDRLPSDPIRLPRHVLQQSVMRKSTHERLFLDDSDMVMRIIWSYLM